MQALECCLFLLLAARPAWAQLFGSPADQATLKGSLSSGRGAVACESKVCSQVGIDILAQGGNAVDAWVGTQLCVGVIGMYHSGLGGGGFALIRSGSGQYTSLDYRETAPAAAFQDMYKDNVNGSVHSGLAVGVPSEIRGLELAHKSFGRLPWKAVVHPAAEVARSGFPITPDWMRYVHAFEHDFLFEDPTWAQDFAPNGTLLGLGDIMTRKRYADTLDEIAEKGPDAFYTGRIANATIDIIQKHNGTMTLGDLQDYKAIIRHPLNITFRGFKVYSTGAPSSGGVALAILKTMEGYSFEDDGANLTMHRFDEAMRFAYGAHQQLADPDFVPEAMLVENKMVSDDGAAKTRALILDNTTQPVRSYLGSPFYVPSSHGTSHIVAVDGDGMAVSSTTTVNLLFGNQMMVPETGVILNNEQNDFSIPGVHNEFGYAPSPANFIRANKRSLSSITPMMVEHPNGTLYLVAGAAGGSRIISATTQVVWRVLEQGLSMRESLEAPRIHDQLMPNAAVIEAGFDVACAASLAEKGHNVTWIPFAPSSAQGIRVLGDSAFEAVGEPRQKNSAGLTL